MVIKEGKRERAQQIALIKLIWGLTVTGLCLLGLCNIQGWFVFVLLGAVLDGIDSFVMGVGGLLSASFFAIAGMMIGFICFQLPWWKGMCIGLCVEGSISGLIGYGWRLSVFISKEKGPFSKKLKRAIRRLLESL